MIVKISMNSDPPTIVKLIKVVFQSANNRNRNKSFISMDQRPLNSDRPNLVKIYG